jgi:hypothetical protein
MSFNLFINDNIAYENANIHFTVIFAKNWSDSEFVEILKNMEVCTKIELENNISIFKN